MRKRNISKIPTVSNFELDHYLGTCYEIARLLMKHSLEDSTDISAVDSFNENKALDELLGEATVVNGPKGKFEVSFLPEGLRWIPFSKGHYWVLKGELDLQYLWLLNREVNLDKATKHGYLNYAESLGYDLSALIHTLHTGHKTA